MHITRNLGAVLACATCGTGTADPAAPGDAFTATSIRWAVTGGEGTAPGVDADALTFNEHRYHQRFSRLGSWHWRRQGMWTKVRDADCAIGRHNEIWCTVQWQ